MTAWVDDLVWSGIGFVLGFTTCWFAVRSVLRQATHDGVTDMRRIRSQVWQVVFGVAILLLLFVSSVRYHQSINCQTEYNQRVAKAVSVRAEATGDQLAAQKRQLESQLAFLESLNQDREQNAIKTRSYIIALRENIAALGQLEGARSANPLSDVPHCGS